MKTQRQRSAARKRQDKADFEACMEREDWICQRCGSVATQVHHCRSKRIDLRHEPKHHIAVCYPCHIWFHANPKDGREWLEERGMW